MLLVDSSVWIDIGRAVSSDATRFVDARDEQDELATTGVIVQEVLQGTRTDRHYEAFRERFCGMLILEPREISTYEIAAQIREKLHPTEESRRSFIERRGDRA